ncbi:MAG: type II secretion system F family protein, partial [Gallionella sp.]
MAVAPKTAKAKEYSYLWEGKDKSGKLVKGEMRAPGEASISAHLRRQGVNVLKIKRLRGSTKPVTAKDIALFTRQLATMLKSGVPLLQAFDIVGKGHSNPSVSRLLFDIKSDVETGSSLQQAFKKYPLYFDELYCNLIGAGEAAGILDTLLDRLATYQEKIQAIKSKIKSALFYPVSIIVVAFIITAVIMIFVIPAFKELFSSFGADLPAPTLFIMAVS